MAKSKLDLQNLQPFAYLLLGIFLVVGQRVGLLDWLRFSASYVFEPVSFVAESSGENVSKWKYALTDASSYISELSTLRGEVISLRSDMSGHLLLEEENESLRLQALVADPGEEYVMSKVLNYSPDGSMSINAGQKDGVAVGDVVQVGSFFIGVVSSVDYNGASVRVPVNKSSHFEVVLLSGSMDENNKLSDIDALVKASGVASGSSSGIKLENIGINANVQDGDIVAIRDERVSQILILGRVVGLANNPASTSKSGFVSPIYDYANLITVFIKKN